MRRRIRERVTGIVLRATFLGTRGELDGAFLDALPRFYPDLSDDFLSVLPAGRARASRSTPTGAAFSMPIPPCTARPPAPGMTPNASCPNTPRRGSGSILAR